MIRIIALFLSMLCFGYSVLGYSAQLSGEIEFIRNARGNVDNFTVRLKPGWTRQGCTGGDTASAISIDFTPIEAATRETFNRSFSIALAAFAKKRPVTIMQETASCTAEAYGIVGQF